MDYEKYQQPVAEWVKFVVENHKNEVKKSREYCTLIYQYAIGIKAEELIGYSLYYLGEADYIENNVDGLFLNITKALYFLAKTKQWELLARGYNMLGISSMSRGNAPFAMDYYLNALSYCKTHKLKHVGLIVNMNIGTLYQILGDFKTSQKYFTVAEQYLNKMKDLPNYDLYLLNYYSGMGNTQISMGKLSEAEKIKRKAENDCLEQSGVLEKITFNIFACRLANEQGDLETRNNYIFQLEQLITNEIELLSVFDDLFMYSELLLKIKQDLPFAHVINIVQHMAQKANIVSIQLQALDLKIRYAKQLKQKEEVLQLSGAYYEISQKMQTENQFMIQRMIQVRNYLEESRKISEEMERKNKILLKKSETDPLTGLYNRFRLNTYAEEIFVRANRSKENLTVEILDIDHFKEYNDHYGHQAGDECIIKISEEIKKIALPDNVFCARYGGDEFILIFDRFSKEQVVDFTKQLRNNTMDLQIEHKYAPNSSIVTISQGICQDIPRKKNKVWDFLSTADNMLYRVKQYGRNNIAIGSLGALDGEICVRE